MAALTTTTQPSPIEPQQQHASRFTVWMLITGITLAAFNLRTAVTSIGAILEDVQVGLNMPTMAAGLLTTLPVLAFAAFGAFTPALIRRWGHRLTITLALTLMSAGLIARSLVNDTTAFLIFSTIALIAGAIGNVAIPGVIKKHFPHRIGRLTMLYSSALAAGTTLGAAATVPVLQIFDSWRPALAIWAIPAALAIVPWLLWKDTGRGTDPVAEKTAAVTGIWRSKLARRMMVFFGLQSGFAYIIFGWLPQMLRDTGYTATQAGLMFGYLTLISIPIYMVVPILAARAQDQTRLYYVIVGSLPVGVITLWLGPTGPLAWVAITLIVVGMTTFPLCLTLFGLRARTHQGTAALSAFSQSAGYLVAGTGPFVIGGLYSLTDGWDAPMIFTLAMIGVFTLLGRYVVKDRYLEDELAAANATRVPQPRTDSQAK